jgi:nitroreductase
MKYEDNYPIDYSNRSENYGENDLFLKRWSPRSFQKGGIPQSVLQSIFSAARWTQSCFNDQPWMFVTDSGESDRELFLDLLLPRNKEWAEKADLVGYIFARKNFERNDKPNDFAQFDTGASWMALTLQARLFGLYTHGMAGIKKDEVHSRLNVSPLEYDIICGFVIGIIDDPDQVSEALKRREKPSPRKPLDEVWFKGRLKD